jgi:chain length determinant protein (polysaccharide antigen chain regulator)
MQYGFYRKLNVDPERISVYRQDGSVEVPESPIKPKKGLIIGLGFFAGLLMGAFIALTRYVLSRNQADRWGGEGGRGRTVNIDLI